MLPQRNMGLPATGFAPHGNPESPNDGHPGLIDLSYSTPKLECFIYQENP